MLPAMVTRAPRASRCCFAVSMRSRSDGEEIARTAMCADLVIARGLVKCLVPSAECRFTSCLHPALGTGHWALKNVERTCKPNSVSPCQGEDHSSVTRVSAVIEQPTRKLSNGNGWFHRFPIWSCSAGGLPCRRRSRGTRCALTAPFHPCPPPLPPSLSLRVCVGVGGLFSVALSVALPRLDVIQPATRWSSDFPPPFDKLRAAILRSAPHVNANRSS